MALRLARILRDRGISLGGLETKSGLSKTLLSRIINQQVPISGRSRARITAFLDSLGDGDGKADWFLAEGRGVVVLQQDVLMHWKLNRDPFINEITDPVEDCFLTSEARWVERNVKDAIRAKGFFAIVGITGSGKSTLMDRIVCQGAKAGRLAVAQPRMCDTEALHAGAIYDTVIYDLAREKPPQSREARARKMVDTLIAKRDVADAVLIVEEAHRLHHSTLRALKSFYDEKLHGQRLLSICLLGQPPLRARLDGADMLEVGRRCQVYELKKFTKGDLKNYLGMKLGKHGLDVERVFAGDAIEAMAIRATSPLEANVLAAAAMTVAWEQGGKTVTKDIVNEC